MLASYLSLLSSSQALQHSSLPAKTRIHGILEESPEFVALLPESAKVGVDPETVEFVRLTTQMVHDLMGLLRRHGALSDLTLLTTVEDLEGLTGDVLDALPSTGEEE